jgi:hypothetical protein
MRIHLIQRRERQEVDADDAHGFHKKRDRKRKKRTHQSSTLLI